VLNPLDKHALEAALSMREAGGGEVVLLSMAPPFAAPLIREGLAMGADRAVILSDPAFAGSDTLATSHILAAGCRWIGEFDLVLLGNLSVDGSTAQVCSQLAELLGLPSVMHVIGLARLDADRLEITQKIEYGFTRLQGDPPLVLAVRKELNQPRYTSFTGILAAESKEMRVLTNEDLALNDICIGLNGSPTQPAGLEVRRFQRTQEQLEGSTEEIVQKLADKIHAYGII
jgi:electron transfer flavoprotein beta subunit